MHIDSSTLARFWPKVNKEGPIPPHNPRLGPCWLWQASRNAGGYGSFGIDNGTGLAHRVSYTIHYGPIPEGLDVLHRCDVRACVRPAHLFLGTDQDNVDDKVAKGRHAVLRGSDHGEAKLTEAEVYDIRQRAADDERYADIAAEYGIAAGYVTMIVAGKVWKHVPLVPRKQPRTFSYPTPKKLTADDVRAIRRRAAAGESRGDLAAAYGINRSNIRGIVVGKTWKHVT